MISLRAKLYLNMCSKCGNSAHVLVKAAPLVSRAVENKYRTLYTRAINQQVAPIIKIAGEQGADSALQQIPLFVRVDPIKDVFTRMFREVGTSVSYKFRKRLLSRKADATGMIIKASDPDFNNWAYYFEEFILPALLRKSEIKLIRMTDTTERLIRESIQRGTDQGFGIDKIAKFVRGEMDEMTWQRARTIAQTEVIGASNQAAFEGANSAGIDYKKFWSNSGLEGIRESHIFAQEWSYDRDGIDPDDLFDMGNGTFMLHPGDPNAPPEEVINCRCTLIVLPT
jgi:hypothetical protein